MDGFIFEQKTILQLDNRQSFIRLKIAVSHLLSPAIKSRSSIQIKFNLSKLSKSLVSCLFNSFKGI